MEDRCSLSPAVDILSYSEREWKGNTAKSGLIKKVCACSSLEEVFQIKASSLFFFVCVCVPFHVSEVSRCVTVCCCRVIKRCPRGLAA